MVDVACCADRSLVSEDLYPHTPKIKSSLLSAVKLLKGRDVVLGGAAEVWRGEAVDLLELRHQYVHAAIGFDQLGLPYLPTRPYFRMHVRSGTFSGFGPEEARELLERFEEAAGNGMELADRIATAFLPL